MILLFAALDLASSLYRRSNYPLTNHTHADYVDVILTTVVIPFPFIDQIPAINGHFGAFEAAGTCVYFVNPIEIFVDQHRCKKIFSCSHNAVFIHYISAIAGRCIYRYKPCPPIFGLSSITSGYTKFDCRDHTAFLRTCVTSSKNSIKDC